MVLDLIVCSGSYPGELPTQEVELARNEPTKALYCSITSLSLLTCRYSPLTRKKTHSEMRDHTQTVKSRSVLLVIQLVSGGAIIKTHIFLTSK